MLLGPRLAVIALLFVAVSARADEEKILNVYNWADYIGDATIADFERETGISVRYDVFDNNETLHAKLVAGRSGYDVVVPSSYWARLQAAAGLLRPLDKAKLPNLVNLEPWLMDVVARLDPGNRYVVPWLWGYTTVGINVGKVRAALGSLPMPDNAWDLVFDPRYLSKLAACGTSLVDAPTEVVPPALHYLGKPAYSSDVADYAGVPALLRSIRPHVTLFSSAGYINELANGSLCLVMGYSGDIEIARRRAIESKTGQDVRALLPRSGGILFVDTMAIPVDAPHPDNAHRFIDYILRPRVHAGLTNKVFYASPNGAARAFIRPDVAGDPTVFPGADDLKRMAMPAALSPEARKLMTRQFTQFKTGS